MRPVNGTPLPTFLSVERGNALVRYGFIRRGVVLVLVGRTVCVRVVGVRHRTGSVQALVTRRRSPA